MRDYADVLKQARTCANRKYCDIGGDCEYLDVCWYGGEKDILKDAADAIEELQAAMPHWISVEERLPEPYQNVLTCAWKLFGPDRRRVYGIDYTLDNGEWACGGESYKTTVTHWMPLPKPPEEERE